MSVPIIVLEEILFRKLAASVIFQNRKNLKTGRVCVSDGKKQTFNVLLIALFLLTGIKNDVSLPTAKMAGTCPSLLTH